MKQITFTAIGFLGIAALSLAAWPQQPQNSSPPAERERSGETMQQNVRKWVLDILGKKDQKISTGSIGQREAIVGREDLAVSGTALPPCDVKPGDPMETIVRMAAKTRVVIINERHNSPLERDYVGQVLKALRPLGYSIYAAEAFNYADLNTDKVYGDVGWYTNDPVFARTMQLAHSLGYRMLAYEQNAEQEKKANEPRQGLMNAREQDEAQNLFDALSKDPKLKMVVHSGAAHAWESPLPDASSKGAWMAARFKLLSGIDPLTISQIECVSTNGKEVLAAHRLKEDGTIDPDNHTDLIIGHPPTLFTDGRPAWRRNAGDLAVPAPSTLLPVTEPTILEARREADGLGVMPVDRLLLYPGDRLPLLLPPGRYRVDAFNAAGRVNNESVIVSVGR